MDFYFSSPQNSLEEMFGGFFHINAIGPIHAGDSDKFSKFLRDSRPPPRTTVYIDSTGGDVGEAIKIGRMIRGCWFSTEVGQYRFDFSSEKQSSMLSRIFVPGKCMSSATLMFLGGRLRYFNERSEFGVHQFKFPAATGESVPKFFLSHAQTTSATISEYIAEMGVSQSFLATSASVPSERMLLLGRNELERLGLITGGHTKPVWSIEANAGLSYVRGERDTLFGHQKIMLGFRRETGFVFWSVIESQGRQNELLNHKIVEIVVDDEKNRFDISQSVHRAEYGIYIHLMSSIPEATAKEIAYSGSFGVQVRFSLESEVFLGIAPMDTLDGKAKLQTFYENHKT